MVTFKIHRSLDKLYYVTIIARNGRVLFTSETYKRKQGALKAIAAVQSPACIVDSVVEKV